jgi:hypothetical protein
VELRYDLTFAVAFGTAAGMSRRRWRRTSETSEVRSMTGSWSGTWNVFQKWLASIPDRDYFKAPRGRRCMPGDTGGDGASRRSDLRVLEDNR